MTEKIMVVDGVPTNRIVMKVRLSAAAHEVQTLASGSDALERLRQELPRAVIIGASLPDRSTVKLCRDIRNMLGCSHLPILLQVDAGERLAALDAGASAILDPQDDDQALFARIRSLLRQSSLLATPGEDLSSRRPPPSERSRQTGARAVFVADQVGTALAWRYALHDLIPCDITICDPERALAEAQSGPATDLYVISADIQRNGDGLRLLSELQARPFSRDAAFLVALRPERAEAMGVALDLGAGDVLPHMMSPQINAAEAAIRIKAQLERKFLSDRRRREATRNILWAMTDPLTGLHNRRYAMPRLGDMVAQAARDQTPLAVLALDLDRFKRVNDAHGHSAGDQVLIGVSERLRDALPANALLSRTGGEEFLAVIPLACADEALVVADTVREAVARTPLVVQGETGKVALDITVSVGVALMPAGATPASSPVELLLSRADRALLCAKSQGRNRIILAPQGLAA